jgi:hypothetical protein
MLVRKFISHRLTAYYSQPSQSVVGGLQRPIPLHWGRLHWLYTYKKLYRQNLGQWLTPVELFQPYYSEILVNWINDHAKETNAVHIVELGAGRGTNARIVLDTLRKKNPSTFHGIQYTIIDSSSTLIELQQTTLSEYADMVNFQQKDLRHVSEGSEQLVSSLSKEPTVVLALEVWDNLPHDKIRVHNGVVEQAEIRRQEGSSIPLEVEDLDDTSLELEETFKTLTDPLLISILDTYPRLIPRQGIFWIPTVAFGVLQQLRSVPHLSMLVADFDWLPPGDVNGNVTRKSLPAHKSEPIITCMNDVDHPCYVQAPILSDILFPTDFRAMAGFSRRLWNDSASVKTYKQREFLQKYGHREIAATTNRFSGFNPMISDFDNCSVMTISSERNTNKIN